MRYSLIIIIIFLARNSSEYSLCCEEKKKWYSFLQLITSLTYLFQTKHLKIRIFFLIDMVGFCPVFKARRRRRTHVIWNGQEQFTCWSHMTSGEPRQKHHLYFHRKSVTYFGGLWKSSSFFLSYWLSSPITLPGVYLLIFICFIKVVFFAKRVPSLRGIWGPAGWVQPCRFSVPSFLLKRQVTLDDLLNLFKLPFLLKQIPIMTFCGCFEN